MNLWQRVTLTFFLRQFMQASCFVEEPCRRRFAPPRLLVIVVSLAICRDLGPLIAMQLSV